MKSNSSHGNDTSDALTIESYLTNSDGLTIICS